MEDRIIEILSSQDKPAQSAIEINDALGFSDIEDILEREILIFICLPNEFKNKINALCKRLGNDYVEILQNDISLFEEII